MVFVLLALVACVDARLVIASASSGRGAVAAVTETRSLVDLASNPIRRVVTLLQKMAKKVETEGAEEEALYQKFNCYCTTSGGDLAQAIAESTAKVPQVQSDIEASESELVQLQSDLKSHQEDRTAAKAAMDSAAAQREQENSAFLAESGEFKSYLAALSSAIPAIQKGMAGTFLQRSAGKMLKRAIADASSVTDYDRQMVLSFVSGTSSSASGYVPAGGEIVGILEQIKEDFEKSLSDVETTEAEAVKLHGELMAAKQKQVTTLTDAIETKTVRVGNLKVEIVNMKNDLSDTEAALIQDQKFAADLKGNCDSKQAEWDERKKTRAEELVAIHETIKILNDDDALDLFKKTLPSPSLLQLNENAHQEQQRAASLLRDARKPAGHRVGLDFLVMALQGRSVDFTKVMKMIDDMVAILQKEQVDDSSKKEYCELQIDGAEDKVKVLEKKVDDLGTSMANLDEMISTLNTDLKALSDGIAELDKSVMTATEQRKKEHTEFQELMTNDNAAKELLAFAKNKLNKFYNPSLHTTTPAPELSREDQIANSFSFVQISAHSIEAPAPPPDTWDAYSTKSQETTGVIGMIDLLVRDLDKEMTEAEADEKNAQKEYESMAQDAAAKRAADTKSIANKESAKADAEMDKANAEQSSKAETSQLMATKEYEMQLHQECDWLMQNFDLRQEARSGEMDALKQAKATLAGADFSLAQKKAKGSHK